MTQMSDLKLVLNFSCNLLTLLEGEESSEALKKSFLMIECEINSLMAYLENKLQIKYLNIYDDKK